MAFLQDMDTRMDICPDSVLFELRTVESNMLNTRYLRAKYSLLHSIALDKNYLDLTNDSIIAPAVTYFDDKGSADERFKTRYYLGRIYQNSGDEDSAMDSFVDALELSENVTDRLAVARCWSAVATLYCNIYDFNKAIEADSMAGRIFLEEGHYNAYINSLLKTANSYMCLGNMDTAGDFLDKISLHLDKASVSVLSNYYADKLIYEIETNSDSLNCTIEEYLNVIPKERIRWDKVAASYEGTGNMVYAFDALEKYRLYNQHHESEASYHIILAEMYESVSDYEKALKAYKDYIHVSDSIDMVRYVEDTRFIHERYEKDMAIHEARSRNLFLILVLILILGALMASVVSIIKHNKEKQALSELFMTAEKEKAALSKMVSSSVIADSELAGVLSSRLELLNEIVLNHRLPHSQANERTRVKMQNLISDTKEYLSTIGMTYVVKNHAFVSYLKSCGLTTWEIGYCCLYLMGYSAKEISGIMLNNQVYKISSEIRRKLGIEGGKVRFETIIKGIFDQYES